jgi:TFIIF-interacting CTD phosphatase-like protein
LKEHVQSVGPALNYRKTEQMWDSYYSTVYTLKRVSADIKATKEVAAEAVKKVREGGRGVVT